MIESMLMGGGMGVTIKQSITGFLSWSEGEGGFKHIELPPGVSSDNALVSFRLLDGYEYSSQRPSYISKNAERITFYRDEKSFFKQVAVSYSVMVLNKPVQNIQVDIASYADTIPELSGKDPSKTLILIQATKAASPAEITGKDVPYGSWINGEFRLGRIGTGSVAVANKHFIQYVDL